MINNARQLSHSLVCIYHQREICTNQRFVGCPVLAGGLGPAPPLNPGSQHDAIRSSSSSACRILIDTCICCTRPGCGKAAAALDAAFWAPSALIDRKAAVCWSVCLSVCLAVCQSVCLPVWLSVCLSVGHNREPCKNG